MKIKENENGGLTIINGLEKWNIYAELDWAEDRGHGDGCYIVDVRLTVEKEEWKEERYYSRKSIEERSSADNVSRH